MAVYERIGAKAEYLYSYRMLIFLLLQAGDASAIGTELAKFVDQRAAGLGGGGPR